MKKTSFYKDITCKCKYGCPTDMCLSYIRFNKNGKICLNFKCSRCGYSKAVPTDDYTDVYDKIGHVCECGENALFFDGRIIASTKQRYILYKCKKCGRRYKVWI